MLRLNLQQQQKIRGDSISHKCSDISFCRLNETEMHSKIQFFVAVCFKIRLCERAGVRKWPCYYEKSS